MRKSGGIIALIGGILGFLAAIVVLALGGIDIGSIPEQRILGLSFGLEWNGAYSGFVLQEPIIQAVLKWDEVLFTMGTFMWAVVCLNVDRRLPAVLLIICAAAGVVVGVPIVKLFMVMALAGGLMAIFPKPRQPQYA